MHLTLNIKTAMRKKRGALNLTKQEAAKQIGINRLSYGRFESPNRNEKIHQSTYEKIANWLAEDY